MNRAKVNVVYVVNVKTKTFFAKVGEKCFYYKFQTFFAVFFVRIVFIRIFATHSAKNTIFIGKTKRYARLADGNVGNFCELQGKCNGSRVKRGLFTSSQFKAIPTASVRRSVISVPRFCVELAVLLGAGGQKAYIFIKLWIIY